MTLWRRWVEALAHREDATSLALVRIAIGTVVAVDFARAWTSGALALLFFDARDTPAAFRSVDGGAIWGALGGAHPGAVEAITALTIASAAALALGLAPRIAALLTLEGARLVFGLDAFAGGGHDRVIANGLWLLFLADSGRTLSLGCRLRTGRWVDPTPVPAWPRYLMVLQLVVMYTTTGLQKVSPEWMPWGGLLAVHHMLLMPGWMRYDLAPVLGSFGLVTRVATAVTWVWESTFFVAGLWLWRRSRVDLRSVYAVTGVVFHVTLAILANLGPFSAISLALYPSLYTPDECAAALRRLARSARPAAR